MIKNKLDYKLINLVLIVFIVFLIYQTGNLWLGMIAKILAIIIPFFFAFVLAYALHPIVKSLEEKKIPKGFAIAMVVVGLLGIFAIALIMAMPLLFEQMTSLFSGVITFLKELSTNYDISFGDFQQSLTDSFNEIINRFGKYISDGAITAITISISYLMTALIAFSAAVYFLIDMEKIRRSVKKYLIKKSNKAFLYVRRVDTEMKNYLSGFIKITIITIFEYSIVYMIIGHPNAILLGVLAAIASLIPYFGGIFVNLVAGITAFVISPQLFIRTCIVIVILSVLDGNIINPYVYGKTNQVHPLAVIISIFAGGILFGTIGVVISLPVTLILIATYKFFKVDIAEIIDDMKEKR